MKQRILILSGTQISVNPRVVKEADTLSDAGYSVEVVGGLFDSAMASRERALHGSKGWTHTLLVDSSSNSRRERFKWLRLRARRRIWREGYARLHVVNPRQLGYLAPEMLDYALENGADLTIVHNPAATWVGAELIRRGRRVAVDMEDWYSGDLSPEEKIHFPAEAMRSYEREALRGALFSTTTSLAMSEALSAAYGCEPPRVLYNSFPTEYRDSIDGKTIDRVNRDVPSVCWFSQVVGPRRGLEVLIDALKLLEVPLELHLRGNATPEYHDELVSAAPEKWRNRIYFHPQVPHSELISRVAEHDIGLASEMPHSRSRALTITNKLPLYLLAGVPVVASDTDGQREAARLARDAIFLFEAGNSSELAKVLHLLATDSALRSRARSAALRGAEDVFSWQHSAPVLLYAVESALLAPKRESRYLATATVETSVPRLRTDDQN